MKKILSLLLALCLLAGCLPMAASAAETSGTCGENVTWALSDDGVLTISGNGEMANYRGSSSPWYNYRNEIKTVVINEGVSRIFLSAFQECSKLVSLAIPDSGMNIFENDMSGCSSLESIQVGENNPVFSSKDGVLFSKDLLPIEGSDNFELSEDYSVLFCYPIGKSGKPYTVPDGVTSIGDRAFSNCISLTSITIPDSVTNIGDRAFDRCTSLTSITIPDGVTSIGYCAFQECSSLQSVTIPASVTSIEGRAFGGCTDLTSITTPASVTSIGDRAFEFCDLTNVTIPASVTSVGESAFGNCSNLKKAMFMGNAPTVGSRAFNKTSADFCIYYQDSATGWTTPTWTTSYGDTYPCKPISDDPDQPNKTEDQVLIEQAKEYALLDFLGTPVDLDGKLTRLDMAKLMAAFIELEVSETDADSLIFTDCDDLSRTEKAILYALCEAGYIAGAADNSFGPAKTHVRCEAVTSLDRMLNGQNAGKPKKGGYFTDVLDSAWYANFVNSLYEAGIFTVEKGTFSPNANATMGDVLRWFVAAHEKKENGAVSTISLTGETTLKVGEAVTLTATTSPSGLKYGWISSDETVATVSNGRVFGVKAGFSTITAQLANGNSASVNITVSSGNPVITPPITPSDPEPVVETKPTGDGNTATITTQPEGDKEIEVKTPTGETVATVKLPADPGAGKKFEDVKESDWFEKSVDSATAYGLFQGTSDTTFSPNGAMTRGMLAQTLWNLSGKTGYGAGEGAFTDVKDGTWYENAVDWAAKVGVTSGTGSGSFSPEQKITREQMVTMLYRYANAIGAPEKSGETLESFPDSGEVSGFAREAVAWSVTEGVLTGRSSGGENYIAPQGTATRAEVAAVLTRFVEYLK